MVFQTAAVNIVEIPVLAYYSAAKDWEIDTQQESVTSRETAELSEICDTHWEDLNLADQTSKDWLTHQAKL